VAADGFELQLDEMVHGGNALGRSGRRVIFVPYVIPGERIRAQMVDERKGFAFARAVEVLAPAPERAAISSTSTTPRSFALSATSSSTS